MQCHASYMVAQEEGSARGNRDVKASQIHRPSWHVLRHGKLGSWMVMLVPRPTLYRQPPHQPSPMAAALETEPHEQQETCARASLTIPRTSPVRLPSLFPGPLRTKETTSTPPRRSPHFLPRNAPSRKQRHSLAPVAGYHRDAPRRGKPQRAAQDIRVQL